MEGRVMLGSIVALHDLAMAGYNGELEPDAALVSLESGALESPVRGSDMSSSHGNGWQSDSDAEERAPLSARSLDGSASSAATLTTPTDRLFDTLFTDLPRDTSLDLLGDPLPGPFQYGLPPNASGPSGQPAFTGADQPAPAIPDEPRPSGAGGGASGGGGGGGGGGTAPAATEPGAQPAAAPSFGVPADPAVVSPKADPTTAASEMRTASDSDSDSGTLATFSTTSFTNNPPWAEDDSYGILHDTTLNASAPGILWNDWDPDGDPITAALESGPSNAASFTLYSDGGFDYEPTAGWTGTDGFTYYASDGTDSSNIATVTIDVYNSAPWAENDSYGILHDTTLTETAPGVMWDDWDSDGDPITASLDVGPTSGTLTYFNSDGSFEYVPNAGFVGQDSFTYHVNDGLVDSNIATVTIDVYNSAPFADNDSYGILHDTTLTESAPGVMWDDWDSDGDPITASLDVGPTSGTLTYFNSDGSFEYVPNAGFVGQDSFTYHVNDGLVDSNIATVTIDVYNSAPWADDDSYGMLHDTTLTEPAPGVMWDDWDSDGDPIIATLDAGPTNGTLTYFNSDGSFEYVPGAGFVGQDSFTYHVNDGLVDSNIATVTINVHNTAPWAEDDNYSVVHDTTLTEPAPGVLGNDSDGDGDPIAAVLDTGPANGTLTYFESDGSFEYVPNAGFVGQDTLTYHVTDGLVASAGATVFINVVNNPPTATDDYYSVQHDEPLVVAPVGVLENDFDPEVDPITASLDTGPTSGTLTYFNADGSFKYVPNTNFAGSDSFTYKASDGLANSLIATVFIDVMNAAPTAVDDVYYVLPGTFLETSGSGLPSVLDNDTDPDGDDLIAILDTGPTDGTLYDLGPDGHFVYLAGESGTDTFTYKANDHIADSNIATVTIHVVEVSIKYPHGDPSQSATNWGNQDSDEANVGNEFTFSGGAAPGVSTVELVVEAEVTPAGAAADVADWLRWTIQDVGSLQAEWLLNHVDGDVHTGKGLTSAATFTTAATGLPASNGAFGAKTISLSIAGSGPADSTTVEIFYPRDDNNHAGGQAGSPNWFHYWMQARPNANVVYNAGLAAAGRVPGMTGWSYIVAPNKTRIEVGNVHPASRRSYGVGELNSGIDALHSTVIHEEKHVAQIAAADALMPASNGADSFRHGWSWSQATHNHWNKGPDGQWGVAAVDDDGNGVVDDADPTPAFEPGNGDDEILNLVYADGYNNWPAAWPLPAAYPGTYNAPGPAPPGAVWLSPIETDAIRHSDAAMDEHDYASHDWANPGKQHRTNNQWDD